MTDLMHVTTDELVEELIARHKAPGEAILIVRCSIDKTSATGTTARGRWTGGFYTTLGLLKHGEWMLKRQHDRDVVDEYVDPDDGDNNG